MYEVRRDLISVYNGLQKYEMDNVNITYRNINLGISNQDLGFIGNFQNNIHVPEVNDEAAFDDFWIFMQSTPDLIEETFNRYWYLLTQHGQLPGEGVENRSINFSLSAHKPIHLIYSFLIENTRISQIIEKIVVAITHNENLGIPNYVANRIISNTEYLFFRENKLTSSLRLNSEAVRRNAYFRMFGMDLSFGEISSPADTYFKYHKPEISNKNFVFAFERFLKELWQGYINNLNRLTTNTTDNIAMVDLMRQLHDMLISRRTIDENNLWNNYNDAVLSKEEFYSVMMTLWFHQIISANNQLIEYLGATAINPGERLLKLGKKVGLSAHSKSDDLIELAIPLARFLRLIENIPQNDRLGFVTGIIDRTDVENNRNFLTILNLWERTTGHRIKETVGVGQR